MNSLDLDSLEDVGDAERVIQEWAKDRPVVYMEHVTRRFRKRRRETADSVIGPPVDYYQILREEWNGRTHVEKCTLLLYSSPTTTQLCPGAFREMAREMILQIEKVKVEPGTMVGVQAAQSVGESMTQASLNTFHLAGAKRSMTTGITRLKELLNCTSQVPVPYFSNIGTAADPGALVEVRLKGVIKDIPIIWDLDNDREVPLGARGVGCDAVPPRGSPCRWQIRFILKDPQWFPKIVHSRSFPMIVKDVLRCDDGVNVYTEFPRSTSLLAVKKRMATMLEYHIQGIPGCNDIDGDAAFLHRYHATPTLLDLWDVCPDLDLTKISTNCIGFIHSNFGIEAVRTYLVREITRVLSDEGIHINQRHIMLIVDNMTYNGTPQANLYSAINLTENAILKATFQQHTETFATAAARGVEDNLVDVSSQVLMGKLAGVGGHSGVSDIKVAKLVHPDAGPVVEHDVGPQCPSPEYAPVSPEYGDSPAYHPSSPGYAGASDSPGYYPGTPSPEYIMPDLTI